MNHAADSIDEMAIVPARVTIEAHPVLRSTNILAKARAAEGCAAWTVVQATEQSAGRGRRDRDWHSPPGNLYTSTVLRPRDPVRDWPQLSFVAALAVVDMAAALAPKATIRVKWPNDVLADECKLSGILLETVAVAGAGAVIVGVGINVASFPEGTRYGATCLDDLAETRVPINAARAHYLSALARWCDIWSARGFEEIRAAWLNVAHGLEQEVLVASKAAPDLRGRFTGIAVDGRLEVETPDGATERISAGTLSFVDAREARCF
jgi:BirA family transcriptional regulator, biotin operon repressor / biotin---[acetyl-CoA-carboxylase] ligase